MAKKLKPTLSPEQKKALAFKRKKGLLIIVIIILSSIVLLQIGFLIYDLLGKAGV